MLRRFVDDGSAPPKRACVRVDGLSVTHDFLDADTERAALTELVAAQHWTGVGGSKSRRVLQFG
jgi:hypothetical protein